ncbi:MAG: hypothetical protein HGB11_06055 [Chlorobiales bacterium]|nr:hypothetical protein [Chlorobiales bacterium]
MGKPSFRIGYAKLSVDPGQKHLQVEIVPNKTTYQTGEFVSAELRVKDSHGKPVAGEITLAAVDAGVLNLIGYELPDLFETFYQERPLGVTTSESILHLIEQRSYGEKGEARGGGGGEGAGGMIFRQKFVATAYWNPSIITDANGKATVRFRLPDNLTTFRLMASAQSADASFGVTHTDIVVNKPLSLLAALPRFARIGDKFEAGVVVHNYTKAPATITVSHTATGIKSEGEQSLTISLEAGASKEVRFKFEAQTEGTASFSFVAKGNNGYSDAMKISIPIYTPYTKETLALFGSTQDKVSEIVKIPKTIYPGLGEISAQASSTALVGLRESVSYLFDYPYGCIEQKASGVLPYILADDLIRAYALKTSADTVRGGSKALVEKTLADFEKYQTYNGGFSYWKGDPNPSPYATVYAAYTLSEAKAHGFSTNKQVLSGALDYLKELLVKKDEALYGVYASRITKAFALYVLAMNQKFDYSAAELLYQDRAQLPIESRAYLLRSYALQKKSGSVPSAQKQKIEERIKALIQELLNLAKVQGQSAHFEDGSKSLWIWTFSSPVKTTAAVLSALIDADTAPDFAEKVTVWLLGSQKNGRWRTTQENLFVLDALNRYFSKYESVSPDFKAKISLASTQIIEEVFKGRSLAMKTGRAGLDKFAKGEALPLKIERSGQGKLFYGVRLSYYPTYALQPQDNGISIIKEVTPLNGGKGSQGAIQAGEMVKVTLRVAVPEEMHFVAVADPLPAGLEALNPTLRTTAQAGVFDTGNEQQSGAQYFDHIELRDDRVTLFATTLSAGVHTYTYFARATSYGQFTMPPTYAEEMYQPEVFGRTGTARVTVSDLK